MPKNTTILSLKIKLLRKSVIGTEGRNLEQEAGQSFKAVGLLNKEDKETVKSGNGIEIRRTLSSSELPCELIQLDQNKKSRDTAHCTPAIGG